MVSFQRRHAAPALLASALLAGLAGAQTTIGRSSFIVVRMPLSNATSANNQTLPILLDEFNVDDPNAPTLLQTISVPTSMCTSFAIPGDASMALQPSVRGTSLTFPCYAIPTQNTLGTLSFPPATFPRVFPRLLQNGSLVSAYQCTDCFLGQATFTFSGLFDEGTNRMYISGALGSNAAFGGVRMLANQTTRTSTTISNGGTLRTLMSDGRYLYTSYSGSANPNQGMVRLAQTGTPALLFPVNSSVTQCNVFTSCLSTGSGDPHSPSFNNGVFNGFTEFWGFDCNFGINYYVASANVTGAYQWVSAFRPVPSGVGMRFGSGRNNTAGQFVILASQCSAPYSLWHFNTVTRVWTKVTDPPAGSFYKGVSVAPYNSAITQPSSTAAATRTPTGTPSPTRLPGGATNAFQTSSLLTVRTGDAASSRYAAPGVALPVYIDEIDPSTGRVIQSLPVPSVTTPDGFSCTLTLGWVGGFNVYGEQEGQPQLTGDGRAVVFPCWTADAGLASTLITGALNKTVAYVTAGGRVVTRTSMAGLYGVSADANRPLTLRTAVARNASGSPFFVLGTSSVNAGVWASTTGSIGAVRLSSTPDYLSSLAIGGNDPRYVVLYGDVMYLSIGTAGGTNAGFFGLNYVTCMGVPCVPGGTLDENVMTVRMNGTQSVPVAGVNGSSPFDFVFQSPTTAWVAEDTRRNVWSIIRYDATAPGSGISQPWQATQWTVTTSVLLDNSRQLQALTGRVEPASGNFVLYAGYAHRIYAYDTVAASVSSVALAPQGYSWHGVVFSPYDPTLAAPASPSAAATPSAAPSPMGATATSAFQASSLVVVKVGDGQVYATGRFMPAYLWEVAPDTGDVLQELALPTDTVGSGVSSQGACTIAQPSSGTSEGFITQSGNGALLTLACSDRPINSTLSPTGWGRTIAIVKADGSVDTSQRVPDAYYYTATTAAPTYFRNVFTVDGTEFWISGRSVSANNAVYYGDSGIRYKRYGDFGTTQLTYPAGAMEARFCGMGAGSPYGNSSIICALRDGFPAGSWYGLQFLSPAMARTAGSNVTNVPGIQTSASFSQWGWAWESSTRVWIASSAPTAGSVMQYDRADTDPATLWALMNTFVVDSTQNIYTIVGRFEGPAFTLYTAGQGKIQAFNTFTLTTRTLVTAPTNVNFRAIAFAPQGVTPASPSATRSSTQTPSSTPSPSQTASSSQTPSNSPTGSNSFGTTPSITGSPTPSPSTTATPSGTPRIAAFRPGNLLVLRAVNNTALGYVSGRYVPAEIDEVDPISQVVVQTIALPTTTAVNADGSTNYRCVVFLTTGGDTFLQTTADKRAVTLPCYDATPGALVFHNSTAIRRVMAVVWADGTIDTRTTCNDCYIATGLISISLRSVTSADVYSGFLLTGQPSAAIPTAGLRFIPYGGSSSRAIATTAQRYTRIDYSLPSLGPVVLISLLGGVGNNGVQYAQLSGNNSAYGGWPNTTTFTAITGQETVQSWSTVAVTWQFTIAEDGSSIWVPESANGGRVAGLTPYNYNGYYMTWSAAQNKYNFGGYFTVDNSSGVTFQYLTSRTEADGLTLYGILVTSGRMMAYNTVTRTSRQIWTQQAGNGVLGLSWAPTDSGLLVPTASGTPSNTPTATTTQTGTPSASQTPSNTGSMTSSPSVTTTATLSVGASPSNTATPSNQVGIFPANSIVVLRSGNGSTAVYGRNGIAAPVFLDVYDPDAISVGYNFTPPLLTLAMPIVNATFGLQRYRCTLAYGSFWDRTATGASRSGNGKLLSFPCYDVTPGTNLTATSSLTGAPVTIAVVRADGLIDTTTRPAQSYASAANSLFPMVRSAYTVSGAGFYMAGSSATFNGVRYAAYGSTGSSAYMGNPSDSRTVVVTAAFNNIGPGAPTGTDPVIVTSGASTDYRGLSWMPLQTTTNASGLGTNFFLLPGFAAQAQINPDPWGWHVSASSGKVFIADSRTSGSIAVYSFNAVLNGWTQSEWLATGEANPVLSLCGREEGGVTVLYAVANSLSAFTSAVFRINTATRVSTKIITSLPQTQLRAVMLPPTTQDILPVKPSATPSTLPTTTTTGSGTATGTAAVTPAGTVTPSASITSSASATLSVGAVASAPPSPSAGATPTATPWTARFRPNMMIALRGGNSTAAFTATVNLRLLPLFIDVIDTAPGAAVRVVDTIAVPPQADPATGNNGCTLAWQNSGYQQEGFMQRSWDGSVVTWACHTINPGLAQPNTIVTPRTIAVLRADGSIDTRTTISDAYNGAATGFSFLRAVASIDGSAFWLAGYAPGGPNNGLRYAAYTGGATSTRVIYENPTYTANYRFLTMGPTVAAPTSPQLFVGMRDPIPFRGVTAVGTGMPTSVLPVDTGVSQLPGIDLWQYTSNAPLVLGFTFENERSLWTADMQSYQFSPTLPSYTLVQWTFSDAQGIWLRSNTILVNATRQTQHLIGRNEGGTYILYTVHDTMLYRIDTSTKAVTVVSTPPSGSVYFAVALPPVRSDIIAASPSNTVTASQTPSQTPSSTRSTSQSATPTPSGTASVSKTARPTLTPTRTAKPSVTSSVTPSGTAASTATASGTASNTPSQSATGTASLSPGAPVSVTPSGTGSASTTGTAASTPSITATPSNTQTGTPSTSLSRTPARSQTPTGSANPTATPTPSNTPSLTASVSAGATASRTATASPSRSNTPAAVADAAVLFGMTMPGATCTMFATTASLGAALRCALSLSIPMPLADVRLGGTTCENGTFIRFSPTGALNTLVAPACAGQARRLLGDDAPVAAESAAPLTVVSSMAQFGPGKAIWYHDAVGAADVLSFASIGGAPAAGGRRLQSSTRADMELLVRSDPKAGDSIASVQEKQTDRAANIIDSLTNAQSVASPDDSSPLLDEMSRSGFLNEFQASTGTSLSTDSLTVGGAVVDVPSVTSTQTGTPTQTASPSQTGTQTGTPSSSGTGTASPSQTASQTGTPSQTQTGTGSPSQTRTPSQTQTGTGSPSGTGTASQTQTGTGSQSQTGTASPSNTGSPSGTGTPSSSGTSTMTPTMTATSSGTGSGSPSGTGTPSSSGSGSPSVSATPSQTKTRSISRTNTPPSTGTRTQTGTPSNTRTNSATPSLSRTGTSAETQTRTGTGSPSTTATPSLSGSRTALATRSRTRTGTPSTSGSKTGTPSTSGSKTGTPSPSATVTPTPSLVAPAWSDWVAVLRVGDDVNTIKAAAGVALPLYVDYYSLRPGVGRVLSVPLPTAASEDGKSGACTLAMGKDLTNRWNFATEGFPSNSADGKFGVFPCYNVPVGQPLMGDSAKTFATIDASQTVSTAYTGYISSIKRDEAGSNDGWRVFASPNGRKFYTASVAMYDAGFRYVNDASKTDADGLMVSRTIFPGSDASITAGTLDARSIVLYGGKLFALCGPKDAGSNTVFQIGGSGAPTTPTNTRVLLPGVGVLGQAWSFVFADADNLWVSSERGTVKGSVQLWRKSGTTFSAAFTVSFSSKQVYNLAGRVEFGSFVLYGTDGLKLYRYDTAGVAAKVSKPVTLASADSTTSFRGVFFAGAPGSSPSPSASPSKSSPSVTPSKTPKGTPSRSASRKKLRE